MAIKVHVFELATAAQQAIDTINQGEGIPRPGCKTNTYTDHYPYNGQYIIYADSVTRKYLTEEIDIPDQEPV